MPVWAATPSASYDYDAATHYDHSLDSDCQSTPPGCSYVALEHKTDCVHSESRTNNTGLFGILCWSSIIVVGYLSVSRDYDTPSNKFNNSPHRPNYDVRIEPRCTSTTTLKNEMSQYRAYFVPEATDPWGLETLTKHYSRHKDQTWVSGYDEDAEGAVPKKSPSYEVVYQVVTLSVDGSSCFETNYCHEEPGCGGSFEASLSVTTTNSSIGGNTGYVPSAGIYDPNQDVFSGSKKTEKGDGAGGSIKIGDKYFSELTLGNDLDCSESFARDVYFTLPSAKATGEVKGTHHKISLSVIPRVGECGKFDLFLDMSINDPAVAEGQGKYLMELTGPNDPNRPEYGHTNN